MNHVIFITGCPSSGKSSLAKLLQEKLKSPMFEFGWIPEFRLLEIDQSYEDEEKLSFENLNLVTKNYIKHGYSNVIITDIHDNLIKLIPKIYKNYFYKIITLIPETEDLVIRINQRKIDQTGFSDIEAVLESNEYWIKSVFKHQIKIYTKNLTLEDLLEQTLAILKE